jgi:dTDP-4-dehydrorhamnose 3,5-epimerase
MKRFSSNIADLVFFEPTIYGDKRGYFMEAYHADVFCAHINHHFVQDNHSRSKYGVVRGMHYQAGTNMQAKLVRVVRGEILDVVVDLRPFSKTYGQTYSIVLNDVNNYQLYVPKGFAHGFATLSEVADVIYKTDAYFSKESEGGIIYNDSTLNIDWGLPEEDMIISEKDLELPTFGNHLMFDKSFFFPEQD